MMKQVRAVDGMKCGSCEGLVTDELSELARAGATWWNEGRPFTADDLERAAPVRERIRAAPPLPQDQ